MLCSPWMVVAMAAQQTRDGERDKSDNPVGTDHKGDRVTVRHRGRVVFYIPPLAVLGELRYICVIGGFRRDA